MRMKEYKMCRRCKSFKVFDSQKEFCQKCEFQNKYEEEYLKKFGEKK